MDRTDEIINTMNGLVQQISSLSTQMTTMQTSVSSLREHITARQDRQETQIKSHTKQLKTIFNKDTKRNLVIFGWGETAKLSFKLIKERVYELFTSDLQIPGVRIYDIEFIRVTGRDNNIIVVTLYSAELVRQAILNARKLKGKNIYLNYDSSPEERAVKKKLIQHKKILTEQGKACQVRRNVLIVDSVSYTLDQLDSGSSKTQNSKVDKKKNDGKRPLSLSPEEADKNKKTKQGSPYKSDMDVYVTDDEFDDADNTEGPSKNGN